MVALIVGDCGNWVKNVFNQGSKSGLHVWKYAVETFGKLWDKPVLCTDDVV